MDRGREIARRSHSGDTSTNKRERIGKIVAELGMRYEPATEKEAFAAKLALLVTDLAELDPGMLERAVQGWVKQNPFMPRASDLRGMVEDIGKMQTGTGLSHIKRMQIIVRECNANLVKWGLLGVEWYLDDSLCLKLRDMPRRRPEWYDDPD